LHALAKLFLILVGTRYGEANLTEGLRLLFAFFKALTLGSKAVCILLSN
jgi:hypothetical protein